MILDSERSAVCINFTMMYVFFFLKILFLVEKMLYSSSLGQVYGRKLEVTGNLGRLKF